MIAFHASPARLGAARHCPDHEPSLVELDYGTSLCVACRCGAVGPEVPFRGRLRPGDTDVQQAVRRWNQAIQKQGDSRVQR